MHNFILNIFICCLISFTHSDDQIFPVGCFKSNELTEFVKNDVPIEILSATSCIAACKTLQKQFAGIQDGSQCKCGDYYSSIDNGLCNIPCPQIRNQTCGGLDYASVYETSPGSIGPPHSLSLLNNTENSLVILWESPTVIHSGIKGFKVLAKPMFYFNEQFHPREKYYKYSSPIKTAILDGLLPGIKYKVEVKAYSTSRDGFAAILEAWTRVGKPETPKIPELISRTPNRIVVKLTESIPLNGPISFYHIVVVDETLPVIIDHDSLYDYYTASDRSLPYYIAAELTSDNFTPMFTVGDGRYYGKYFNSPLKANKDYHILLGIVSTINETKFAYSESDHSQHEGSHFDRFGNHIHDSHDDEEHTSVPKSTLVTGLSITIGLLGFLLLISVIVYFTLRVYFKRKSHRNIDHQELAEHAHFANQDENVYAIGSHYIEHDSPDHYRNLREKVMIIPYQSINIVGDIGIGKFGEIKKAVILNKGSNQKNALVHRIEDNSLGSSGKNEMLKLFDSHILIGKHENVVSLCGLLEEFNVISIVFEYETLTLKSNLVEARAVQHYPVYAEKNRRFSTIQEGQLLEILSGVAKGMKHLHALGISHGQLCCRNILLKDGILPKISGFGLISFHNDIYIPDYTRWQAPELKRTKLTCKSDIWSFGCLLWEAATLGGTPFADIRTEEIFTRVIRGLRLAQPQYISDDLYQNMLLCWQSDPDERPSFGQLETILKQMGADDITPHLLFSLYSSFSYEPYCPHLEFLD